MPQINETAAQPQVGLAGALAAGLADISQQASITFATYARRVLPLDGYVFWLRTGEFSQSGMLHHTAERAQNEDDTVTTDQIVFTTTKEVVQLNQASTEILIVGTIEGVRYAFRAHGMFAGQAGIWHYTGSSIVASLATQLIDDPGQLKPDTLIVSDSLPAWLSLINYTPPWLIPANPLIPLYPSFLVPDNLSPPFGAVHIDPSRIVAMQAAPVLDTVWVPMRDGFGRPMIDGHGKPILEAMTKHTQLVQEAVRVTLYGCDNRSALAFLDLVLRYSVDTDVIGMMNPMPSVRDDKRPWPEGMLIAQKKTIEFSISYNQSTIFNIANHLITEAATAIVIANDGGGGPIPIVEAGVIIEPED
jgi:hypothetical protein